MLQNKHFYWNLPKNWIKIEYTEQQKYNTLLLFIFFYFCTLLVDRIILKEIHIVFSYKFLIEFPSNAKHNKTSNNVKHFSGEKRGVTENAKSLILWPYQRIKDVFLLLLSILLHLKMLFKYILIFAHFQIKFWSFIFYEMKKKLSQYQQNYLPLHVKIFFKYKIFGWQLTTI